MVVHIFPRHLRKENDKKRFKKPRVFFQKPLIEGQIKQWSNEKGQNDTCIQIQAQYSMYNVLEERVEKGNRGTNGE
jgi:hypothetical protein